MPRQTQLQQLRIPRVAITTATEVPIYMRPVSLSTGLQPYLPIHDWSAPGLSTGCRPYLSI